MTMFGYARVSTRDQDFAGQVAELTAVGCAKVYREKASGAKRDRAELAKVISRLEKGDVLVVTRLDRLARSTRDLLNVIQSLIGPRRGLQVVEGHLGRHHQPARSAYADGPGRPGRVRAGIDPRSHGGG